MPYQGSCHCGSVTFSVDGEVPTEAITCNCSHCSRKGFVLAAISAGSFALESGEDKLVDYRFNRHSITHRFCATCGCQPFAVGKDPDGTEMVVINLNCVPSIDLDSVDIQKVDGASF